MLTYDVLSVDGFDELGVLRVIHVCAERYFVNRHLARDGDPFHRHDLIWFVLNLLWMCMSSCEVITFSCSPGEEEVCTLAFLMYIQNSTLYTTNSQ